MLRPDCVHYHIGLDGHLYQTDPPDHQPYHSPCCHLDDCAGGPVSSHRDGEPSSPGSSGSGDDLSGA